MSPVGNRATADSKVSTVPANRTFAHVLRHQCVMDQRGNSTHRISVIELSVGLQLGLLRLRRDRTRDKITCVLASCDAIEEHELRPWVEIVVVLARLQHRGGRRTPLRAGGEQVPPGDGAAPALRYASKGV